MFPKNNYFQSFPFFYKVPVYSFLSQQSLWRVYYFDGLDNWGHTSFQGLLNFIQTLTFNSWVRGKEWDIINCTLCGIIIQCLNLHVFIQENSYHIIVSSIRTGCLWLPNCLHQIFINICNMYHHLSRTYKNSWQTYLLSYIQPSSSIIDWYKTSLKSEILKMAFLLKIAGKQKCFVFLYFSHTLFTTDKLYEFSIIIVLFLNFSWSLCETLSHYN